MIAKKDWFKPRILGWGLRPVTMEGWIYVLVAVLLFFGALNLPVSEITKIVIAGGVMTVFLVDSLVVMFQMYKGLDERHKKHQQIIETSVAYTAVAAVVIALLYRAFIDKVVDNVLISVLVVMVAVKAIVSLYLWKNG